MAVKKKSKTTVKKVVKKPLKKKASAKKAVVKKSTAVSNYELTQSTFGAAENEAMFKIIKTGFFTMGPNVKAFEQKFAAYFGRKYAVMSNSGSSANLLGIASYFFKKVNPLKRGDEVIVPCISWSTTFHPLQQYGLKLKFVDVDLKTLNYNTEELKKAVGPDTKMIVAVSILGNPCDFDPIVDLCKTHNIYLFEDNCESMGAKYRGKYTGTFGDVSTFSTFFSHHISTMEGGLTLTDDKEVYNLLLSLRNHGWTRDQEPDSPVYQRTGNDFYEAYRFILPGYNVRPGELHGVLGLQQLGKLKKFVDIRRKNAQYFVSKFKDDSRFIIQHETGESSWFCFTMIVNPNLPYGREKFLPALQKANIMYRIITGGNFLRHDAIKFFDHTVTGRANADLAHDRGFFVGNHPVDIRKQIDLLHLTLSKV